MLVDPLVALASACINMVQEDISEIDLDFNTSNPDGTEETLNIRIRRHSSETSLQFMAGDPDED